ncbi:MAG: GNAT family N-acetyltransferase, partial [Planctomycetes bacterium]|nr:GNAT family N-acetyltransferase [Planctomycetota bacterium]
MNRPETCRTIGHGHIDAEIAGFIVTRVGVGGVLSETMTSHPIWFLAALASAIIRRPALLWASFSVIAQLWSRTGQPDDPTAVELFLMAVHADARRRGIGTALVRHSAARLRE